MSTATSTTAALAAWHTRWNGLSTRERSLIAVSVAVVALALLWTLALAPALHTLRNAPARHAQLDAQLQHMRSLQAQAQALQAAPTLSSAQAQRTLQTTLTQQLSSNAKMHISDARAQITFQKVPAATLAHWLAQTRSNAHTTPVQMQLTRVGTEGPLNAPNNGSINNSGSSGSNSNGINPSAHNIGNDSPARWSGTLVLALPTAGKESKR